jgi:hypothetical protein
MMFIEHVTRWLVTLVLVVGFVWAVAVWRSRRRSLRAATGYTSDLDSGCTASVRAFILVEQLDSALLHPDRDHAEPTLAGRVARPAGLRRPGPR